MKKTDNEEEKLKEFFSETEDGERKEEKVLKPLKESQIDAPKTEEEKGGSLEQCQPVAFCPVCKAPIYDKTGKCPKCGYHGYMPMKPKTIMLIRIVLFVLLMTVIIILYKTGVFA